MRGLVKHNTVTEVHPLHKNIYFHNIKSEAPKAPPLASTSIVLCDCCVATLTYVNTH